MCYNKYVNKLKELQIMKEFEVICDVTFSGSFYVEAETADEAKKKVYSKQIVPSDIRNFVHFDTDIQDVYEM